MIVLNVTLEYLEQQKFSLVSFCVIYTVRGVFYNLTWQIFFFLPLRVSHLAKFRGYEAGLFHAYRVIRSSGLFLFPDLF